MNVYILCRYFRNNSNVWLPKLLILNDSDYGRHDYSSDSASFDSAYLQACEYY